MKTTIKLSIFLFCLTVSYTALGQTRIWNMQALEQAINVPTVASKKIVADANKALKQTIPTVMDKEMTPSSGTKHDYMSAGRYWWPDPTKADGLPYIRKDGVSNPEIDKLDRIPLATMTKSVVSLSLAYYLTSDEKYAEKAVRNLRIWYIDAATKMNPNMNFGQTIPGKTNGLGRGEGLIDTYSFVDMLDGVELLKKSPQFTSQDRKALETWFAAYLDWMQRSKVAKEEFDAFNNHGTAFDVQLVRYALFVGKETLAREYLEAFPKRRIFKQIEPNGSQPLELSRTTALGYSLFNLWHILDMCSMAKSLNVDLYNMSSSDHRNITKAIDFLSPYLGKKQSEFPYKQIKEWDESQEKLAWVLYRADRFLPSHGYKELAGQQINASNDDAHCLVY